MEHHLLDPPDAGVRGWVPDNCKLRSVAKEGHLVLVVLVMCFIVCVRLLATLLSSAVSTSIAALVLLVVSTSLLMNMLIVTQD